MSGDFGERVGFAALAGGELYNGGRFHEVRNCNTRGGGVDGYVDRSGRGTVAGYFGEEGSGRSCIGEVVEDDLRVSALEMHVVSSVPS